MGSPLLLPFLLLSCLGAASGFSPEGRALLALSKAMLLPDSVLSTWNSSQTTPCSWVGIRCDRAGHVVSLALQTKNITGELGPEIGQLARLRYLDLSSNGLSGSIPGELGNCTLLQHLDLSSNSLSGEIPETLSNLRRLAFLSLFDNSLTGHIPEHLFNILALKYAYLCQNELTGVIPSTVGNLSRASSLWLNDNFLTGYVPRSIGNATDLEELYLSNNFLSGALPESLSRLDKLVNLDVSRNGFAGRIPLGLGSWKGLRDLILSNNHFEGQIPPELGNCTSLVAFAVVNNSLTGAIPPSFGSLTNLITLYLNQNNLSGMIPAELGSCWSLISLQLHDNQLVGSIPMEMGNLTNLHTLTLFNNHLSGEVPVKVWGLLSLRNLILYNNNFSGQLPPEITYLRLLKNISLYNNKFTGEIPQNFGINSSLVELDFTNNSFSGEIPPNICHWKQLRVLNLGRNLLRGSLPFGVGNCSSLTRLILSHNYFTGPLPDFADDSSLLYVDLSDNTIDGRIPSSLGNCKNLTSIDWSMNKLTGYIPQEIGSLVNLQVLNLSHNNLAGGLPPDISFCKSLYLLDLGYNSLTGSIPTTLSSLVMLTHLILQNNLFTGKIPNFFSQYGKLLELQLGGNLFGGSIPASLGALDSLAIALNLRNNKLVGQVPAELGNLKMLQSLDFSLNNLTGSLTQLSGLTSLIEVNVSYNNFSGPIPVGWLEFLYSSPSSFLGNAGLCAPCQSDDTSCIMGTVLEPCRDVRRSRNLSRVHLIIILALVSLLLGLIVILMAAYINLHRKRSEVKSEPYMQEGSSFLLNKVIEATENLDEKHILGRGAHGTVYKAALSNEKVYALKKLVFSGHKGPNASMIREIQTLGKIRHRNLVKLTDSWVRGDYGLILYEYMPNGSLHDILHEGNPAPTLQWNIRYRIAFGTAQGLAYLHDDCNPAIVHRDIKPKNILLDQEMEPHISDFGIARLINQFSTSPQSTSVVGTIGYMAPETAYLTRKNKESDVYSYGVVLLELMTRKTALDSSFPESVDLVGWVNSRLNVGSSNIEAIVDPDLMHEVAGLTTDLEQVQAAVCLALRCTAKSAAERPSMRDVVKQLVDIKSKYPNSLTKGKRVASRPLG